MLESPNFIFKYLLLERILFFFTLTAYVID